MMVTGSIHNLGLLADAASSMSGQSQSTTSNVESVNKDEFLQLLVAQLQNQDPLDPVDNKDFLAQLATFSSLEQLIGINEEVSKLAEIATGETTSSTESTTLS
jgi:flagellar basal-body rod modification protein FlgD